MRRTPWEVLGVPENSPDEAVKRAWRKLILTCHPDKATEADKEMRAEEFRKVNETYRTITEPELRRKYEEDRERKRRFESVDASAKNSTKTPDRYNERPLNARPQAPSFQRSKRIVPPYRSEKPGNLEEISEKLHAQQTLETHRSTTQGLKGLVNGRSVVALPDTGADLNFMAQTVAIDLGMELIYYPSQDCPNHMMGSGKYICSIARAHVMWQFPNDPGLRFDIIFHILRDCIFDVLIGGQFLDATNTMTSHRYRLSRIPRPRRALHIRTVNLCGSPDKRIRGILNSETCFALPDSGAEPNLVSHNFVQRRGWLPDVFPGPQSCRLLQFADGSIEETDGRILLHWSFVEGWTKPSVPSDGAKLVAFDVLRSCPFDVVVGQDFLDETEAFTKHVASFQDIVGQTGNSGLNLVIWAKGVSLKHKFRDVFKRRTDEASHSGHSTSSDASTSNQNIDPSVLRAELDRRASVERAIDRIEDTEVQLEAKRTENQNRRNWDIQNPGSSLLTRYATVMPVTAPRQTSLRSSRGRPSIPRNEA